MTVELDPEVAADEPWDVGEPGHPVRTAVSGWGRTAPSVGEVVRATTREEAAALMAAPAHRGVIARGLGRSYGDPAQNAGGRVLDLTAVRGLHHLDVDAGIVTAEAGTSLDDLMRWLVPLGWFVPVSPGTRQVTVGGAIANDIHGKNHHRSGSWCDHVEAITIVTPADGVRRIGPHEDPDLFWATAGGLGLTGVILDATFRLKPIETSLINVDTDRTPDLDASLAALEEADRRYDYTVAWLDIMATGGRMGRSIITSGHFAPRSALTGRHGKGDPLAFRSGQVAAAPPFAPNLVNRLTMKAFCEAWYHKAPKRRRDELQGITAFFHPLDLVGDWNRLYGRAGFVQWQCAVPLDATDSMRHVIEDLSAAGAPSFLTVLKRFGPGNPGPLSFPIPGWTLAVDIPTGATRELGPLLDRLDERVVACGGRIYLAKDSRLRPELLAPMYPELDAWQEVRARVDPDRHLRSDLARRLGI